MAAKVIAGAFLIFCTFTVLTVIGNFFTSGGLVRAYQSGSSANQLTSIDFSLFDKNGTGRSYITQGYGHTSFSYQYPGGWHNGIDIAATYGAPIYSPSEGTVLTTGNQDNYCPRRGFGKYVALDDTANHLVLWFAHLGTISVSAGSMIKKGTLIGTVGATGFETGTHLHFSVFDENGFSMTSRNGCGPDPTGHDLDPLSYLGTTYK